MRLIKLLVFAFILLLQIRCTAFKSQEKEITFESQGTQFSGTLCIPKKPQAAVVFVHGSGAQTRNILLARRFVKNGIAAFVYDKRGIGKSGGNYQDNFDSLTKSNIELLAKDASSAVEAIIKHKEIRDVPIGMVGIRQAGWIIPLAAQNNSKVAFIGLWSGPVCSVLQEDIFSSYTHDQDFKSIPSYIEAKEFSGNNYVEKETICNDISPMTLLKELSLPGLWIFGANDGSIPVDISVENLKKLRIDGHKYYDYILFSGVGHNNIETTFTSMVDWIINCAIKYEKETYNSTSSNKLIGLYRTENSTAPPELFIKEIEGTLFVELGNERFKLNHLEKNRYLLFIEGDGYHVIRFDVSNEQMIIDEFDIYSKVNK